MRYWKEKSAYILLGFTVAIILQYKTIINLELRDEPNLRRKPSKHVTSAISTMTSSATTRPTTTTPVTTPTTRSTASTTTTRVPTITTTPSLHGNDTVTEAESVRACTPAERVAHLRHMCTRMRGDWQQPRQKDDRNLTLVPPETRPSYYVNPFYKVFFCKISKVASTMWYGMVMRKSRFNQKVNFTEEYTNYTKFFVIRHPFDRVLSAYYNIVDSHFGYGPEDFKSRHIADKLNVSNYKNLTLENFVDYLTLSEGEEAADFLYDRHWDTYSHLCDVCHVPYDHIIRYENMAQDAKGVLRTLKLNEHYLEKVKKRNSRHKSGKMLNFGELYLGEFESLSSSRIDRLWQRYSSDMTLFGYHFDSSTFTASCQISLPNGDVCC